MRSRPVVLCRKCENIPGVGVVRRGRCGLLWMVMVSMLGWQAKLRLAIQIFPLHSS